MTTKSTVAAKSAAVAADKSHIPDRPDKAAKLAKPDKPVDWLTLLTPSGSYAGKKSGKPRPLPELAADATPEFAGGEEEARQASELLRQELFELQSKLYAQSERQLLIVLQAMDTGGKDGLIRKVFSGVNPLGVRDARFERPTPPELAHDYLWRVHPQVPAKGDIVIFNRSHYEDVLVVRTNKLVPKARWSKRYRHIREFERLVSEEGTEIVKIYLHIDKAEQARRLQARLDDPARNWKYDANDLAQRELWDEYMLAYQDAIAKTDRAYARWHIIPANHKWYRDFAVLNILVQTLRQMNPRYPRSVIDPTTQKIV